MLDAPPARRAFISGPLDPSEEYFATHYVPQLDAAIAANDNFAMGPMQGIDALALQYLVSRGVLPSRITVFMAGFEYADRARRSSFERLGIQVKCVRGANTTRERDAEMTRCSDYDILRYRTEEEAKALYGEGWWPRVSNTEINERRRRGISSLAYKLEESGSSRAAEVQQGKQTKGLRERVMGKLLGRR